MVPCFIGPLLRAPGDRRMFPRFAPISPTGYVQIKADGRTPWIAFKVPRGVCTWCGGEAKAPRRTWCSKTCADHYLDLHWGRLRRRAFNASHRGGCGWKRWCAICNEPRASEIDHTIPIVEGGHPFDLSNLRALCNTCHTRETKALAGRRAEARRCATTP